MCKLNIYSLKTLSERSWISRDFLLSCSDGSGRFRKKFFSDHKNSKITDDITTCKYIRVVKYGSQMQKFHKWINWELKRFDSKLPLTIYGWVEEKSTIDAISIHIRGVPFVFIKSDLSRFFESIPKEQIFSLFCGKFNCDKIVAEVISNSITFPQWPLGSKGELFLARWLHVSSRIAVWSALNFFKDLCYFFQKKYKKYKPKISYYVDDIGISLVTTDQIIIDEFMADLVWFVWQIHKNSDFLNLHPDKTNCTIIKDNNDFVEYLWGKIYMNRKDISNKTTEKTKQLYFLYKKAKTIEEKNFYAKRLTPLRSYKKRMRSS
ncbi:MAG: hypothetical protein ACD_71C00132G0002 [uncultured bacterium (gcode 4)]|uniref:Reverse transcriptase domain-containing protein n=1 Tax=uncultured bacterium (gcode 4) TaxID=1234023 RepID=K1YN85_9BACT|nr:MAG: hypothetical protein ACD_71C00132G0002 [uncultured bacterium (gcode 4)]